MANVETDRIGDVLTVTLSRPDRLNALTYEMLNELGAAWQQAVDPDVRAVVVTGAGRGFCAGADLRDASRPLDAPHGLRYSWNPQALLLASLAKPVIAAVNGAVAGAGLGLALAADIALASTAATFIPAFGRIGAVPDNGTSHYVVRCLGYPRAFEWLSSGATLAADEALRIGLVRSVHQPDELLPVALELAARLAAMPGSGVGLTKALLNAALATPLAQQLELEQRYQDSAGADPARAAARQAAVAALAAKAHEIAVPPHERR